MLLALTGTLELFAINAGALRYAALSDGSKMVRSAVLGYRESPRRWSKVLGDLSDRGPSSVRLVFGDGHLGI